MIYPSQGRSLGSAGVALTSPCIAGEPCPLPACRQAGLPPRPAQNQTKPSAIKLKCLWKVFAANVVLSPLRKHELSEKFTRFILWCLLAGDESWTQAASQKLSGHGCLPIEFRQSEIFAEAQRETRLDRTR